jgi:type II secretory pathway pseudopilin PulG
MLLVIAIISILAALAISHFSNASQDTREIVARQQLAVVQEAVSHWVNQEIGHVTTSGGTGKSIAQVRSEYNATADVATRFDKFKTYLDDATLEDLKVNNTTGRITSSAMGDAGRYLMLPNWETDTLSKYPKVQLLP